MRLDRLDASLAGAALRRCLTACCCCRRHCCCYREGETVNVKSDHIAAFAVARALLLNDTRASAVERLGLGI